jgi:hypothetical protein
MTITTTEQSLCAGPERDRLAEEPRAARLTGTERWRRRSAIRRVVLAAAVPVALATAQPAYAGLIDAPLGSVPIAGSPAGTDPGAAPASPAPGVPSLANLPGVGGPAGQNAAPTPTAPSSPPATPAGLPANPTSTSSCTQTPSTATNSCSQTAPAASSNSTS